MAGFNFNDIEDFYESGKIKKKKGMRDELIREDNKIKYNLWGNKIAEFDPQENTLEIDDAGWKTKTTKDRLNKVIPEGYIQQKKYEWYYKNNDKEIPFRRGMKVNVIAHRRITKNGVSSVKNHYRNIN